jgi:FkbM family methyltransferase
MAVPLHARLLGDRRVVAGAKLLRRAMDRAGTTPAHRAWRAADGDRTLRLEYDLTPESNVIDVGGFEGQWASDIVAMYGCRVEVFEPVPDYAASIERRFARNPQVTVHAAGLAPEDGSITLDVSGDASSHARADAGGPTITVPLRSVGAVIDALPGQRVDLIKINIEGAEYDLLDHLVDSGLIERIRDVQVQFHTFVPDAETRLARLQTALARTHRTTYQYEFLWENWRRLGT